VSASFDLARSALLVLDWQLFFVSPDSPARIPEAAAAGTEIETLVDRFLAAGRPVFATRHGHPRGESGPFLRFYGRLLFEDDPLAELAPFLAGRGGVRVIPKSTYSAFASSALSQVLGREGVESLVLAGCQTDKCVLANALAAFDSGFDVSVVREACAARSLDRRGAAFELMERSCATLASAAEISTALALGASKGPE
jgi:nicotinamidase-related amidase